MAKIHILSEHLANKIAAGEVIDRPSSIVKELVENAMDAGASSIEINFKHGGKSLIQVSDNGFGMTAADAELAFERHATSKISTAEELHRIKSYGFRGEALPSIAAVSRARLVTRIPEASSGAEVQIEGGRKLSVKEAACRPGTIVEVRDLFFNTPARRKFMKSDNADSAHIGDVVSQLAFCRLDIHFILKNDDQIIFDLLPANSILERYLQIRGEANAKQYLEFSAEYQGVRFKGILGKPLTAKANRTGQLFYVNHRWVKSTALSFGLQAGYHGMLMHGQYPVAVVFLEVDLEKVDVNVHPTKQEIRLSGESQIKSFLQEAVARRLSQELELAPSLQTARSAPPGLEPHRVPLWGIDRIGEAEISYSPSHERPEEKIQVFNPEFDEIKAESLLIRGKLSITKILGQIHHTFIVAETQEGLIIFDQHAAHERVQYERLMQSFETHKPIKQALLMSEMVKVSSAQKEILIEKVQWLQEIGFEIDPFGADTFIIRAVPFYLQDENPERMLLRFLEEIEDGVIGTQLEHEKSDLAALIACQRQSARAYDPLNEMALKSLLGQLSECRNPFHCPHGRPAFLKYTFEDLEKQFKRKL